MGQPPGTEGTLQLSAEEHGPQWLIGGFASTLRSYTSVLSYAPVRSASWVPGDGVAAVEPRDLVIVEGPCATRNLIEERAERRSARMVVVDELGLLHRVVVPIRVGGTAHAARTANLLDCSAQRHACPRS